MFFRQLENEDKTVVAMLASALRRDISFGELRPDQKLKISELRSRYGGSNNSMRESLRVLSAEGMVEATAQRGFRVTSATYEDICDIAFIRKEIEVIAIGKAIKNGDVSWEGRVIGVHHELRKAEKAVEDSKDEMHVLEWDEACRVWSFTLFIPCGSRRLAEMQLKYFDQSRRFRLASLREGNLDFASRERRQQSLMNAILTRDVKMAEKVLKEEIEAELNI